MPKKKATRTVKVSDRTAKLIKIGAAVLGTTQEEFVTRAVGDLYEDVKLKREIAKHVMPEHKARMRWRKGRRVSTVLSSLRMERRRTWCAGA